MVDQQNNTTYSQHGILFISRLFPPIGGSGVQRIVKTIKYFNQTDYRIYVLTTKRIKESYWPSDPSLLNDVSPAHIARTTTYEPTDWAPNWLRKLLYFLLIPDNYILWVFWAVPAAIRIVRKEQIPYIYATGPSFVNFIIGAITKRYTKSKLILEYRDGWTLNPYNTFRWHLRWRYYLEHWLEKKILRMADHIIFVTRGTKQLYCAKIPKVLTENRVSVVYNGYDPDDFMGEIIPIKDKCIFTYVGVFFSFRRPDNFLKALAKAIQNDSTISRDVVVRFVGGFISSVIEKEVRECIHALQLDDNIEYVGNVSHSKSVEYLRQSTINLFITGNVPGGENVVAGKTFEYLAAMRPVLALTYSNGEAGNMFIRAHLGVIVDDTKETVLAGVIATMVNDWRTKKAPVCDLAEVNKYAKPKLVNNIKIILESLNHDSNI